MSYKNTKERYGTIAKTFHWLMTLLFLAAYASFYYRYWFTEAQTPANWTSLQLHLSVGVSIGVLVMLRIIWKFMTISPDPLPGTKFEHLAAKIGHCVLYGMMVIMVLTGYFGTGVDTEFFFMFDIPKFADTALFTWISETWQITFKEFEAPMDFIHKQVGGEWIVWMLILGHAGAALYHHYIKKDDTLRKMI